MANLMQRADAAMYRAKERGRNTWCFYDGCGTAAAVGAVSE
jgi:hypothetical protein